MREGKKIVKKYIDKNKLTFPVLLDIHGNVEKKYGVRAHPGHFLINKKGDLIGKTLGPRIWTRRKNLELIRFLLEKN